MKGSNNSTPWAPIAAGVLALFTAGLLFRNCTTRTAPDAVEESQLAAKRTKPEHDGWIAQPGAGGSGTERHHLGTNGDRMTGRSESSADFAPSRAGSVRDSADFRDTDMANVDSDAIPAPQGAPRAAAAVGGAAAAGGAVTAGGNVPPAAAPNGQPAGKPNADKNAATTQTQDTAPVQDAAKNAAADSNAPVLSLPLDKSVDPEKGDTAPIIANGITFDQNGAHFSSDAQLFIPNGGNVNPAAGTFSFWMLPDWAGDIESQFQILHFGANTFENHIDIFKDYRYLRFLFTPNTGYESGESNDISYWKKGERHMVTTTWGDGVTVMYIDGASVGERDYDGELDVGPDAPLYFGSGNPKVKGGANSNIRNFQVYDHALSADDVATLYTQPPS